jgi:hypothetical protein
MRYTEKAESLAETLFRKLISAFRKPPGTLKFVPKADSDSENF